MQNDKIYLRKRDNGIYQIGYYVGSRIKWRSAGTRLKSEALKALQAFQQSNVQRVPPQSISGFIAEFTPYASQNFSKGTLEIYQTALNYFSQIIGDTSLSSLTQRHADIYKTERLQALRKNSATERVKPATVNCEIRTLRAAFNTAVRWKLMRENPFKGVSLALVPETSPIFFRREDIQTLLDSIRESWIKNVVVFAALTGMRRGEIINLRWDNVSLNSKMLYLESTDTFKMKSGRKRTIPLSESALYLLRTLEGQSVLGYVFEREGRQINGEQLSHRFKEYVRTTFSNDSPLHFHSIRHSIASWLVMGGATLYEVQVLLGHSSPSMTMRYSHLLPSNLHSTVNKVQLQLN